MTRIAVWTTLLTCWLSGLASAQAEPAPILPPPTPLVPAAPPVLHPGLSFPRQSSYDVWKNYGIDGTGRFRLRVIHAPQATYYYYNGRPYPWFDTHSRTIMPAAAD